MKEEIKSSICNGGFFLAFTIMMSCYLGYSLPTWIYSINWGSGFQEGALQLSIGGIFFGSSMLLLPFCASISYSINQIDEYRSSVLIWKTVRSSTTAYAWSKILASMISASLSSSLAFILHAYAWNIIVPPYKLEGYQQITFDSNCIYALWNESPYAFPIYIWIAAGIAFCSAIWAVVALAVSVWFDDKLLTITIPVCIYYLWSCRITYYIGGYDIPHPAALYNDALTFEQASQSVLVYAVLLVASIVVYLAGLKRRIQNA